MLAQALRLGARVPRLAEPSAAMSLRALSIPSRASLLASEAAKQPEKPGAATADGQPSPGANGAAPLPHAGHVPTASELAKLSSQELGEKQSYWLMQPVYDQGYLDGVRKKHKVPKELFEKTGYWAVQGMRGAFDIATRYNPERMTEKQWMTRFLFLETVAGVPGFVAGMLRHMRSLRRMQRDHGWIHTLLEEAENERMHLLTFLEFTKPGPIMRLFVLLGQGVFFNLYTLCYILSPRHCHSFVGYLEEEAIHTYTKAIESLDAGRIPSWVDLPAPENAKAYWRLADNATMRDILLNVRADEACHSYVNHTFSQMKDTDDNPFDVGTHEVP